MKSIIAKNTWLKNSDLRLDAAYHLSDGQLTLIAFKKAKIQTEPLKNVTERIFYGGRSRRVYVNKPENGLPFIKGADIVKADFSNLKIISRKRTSNLKEYYLGEGWTVITRSGTVGNTAYVNKDFVGKAASDDIIRVVPKTVPAGFLYAFLSSKNGRALITNGTYGAVIQHIEPEHIENIPIPIFQSILQQQIHELISESAKLRVDGNKLLEEAEQLFLEKINVSKYDENLLGRTEKGIGNIFSINKLNLSSLSLRARNYSPRKLRIIELFKINNYDSLIDVLECAPFYGARFKRIEANNQNIELFSQGDIFNYKPEGRFISKRNIKNIENEIVKKGFILIPAQGTLGENEIFARAKFVWGYLEDKLVAGHAMRFIPNSKKIGQGYLFTVLSSKMWFRLLRNSVYGTNLLGFIVPFLNDYPIPRFDDGTEQIIDEKVKIAYDKLTASINCENKAIQLVEKEIEQWQN
jgi:restriction endonuclease S subunit